LASLDYAAPIPPETSKTHCRAQFLGESFLLASAVEGLQEEPFRGGSDIRRTPQYHEFTLDSQQLGKAPVLLMASRQH